MYREAITIAIIVPDEDGNLKIKQIEEFTDSKSHLDCGGSREDTTQGSGSRGVIRVYLITAKRCVVDINSCLIFWRGGTMLQT